MEGPRPIRPEELPSLSELVDTVFTPGRHGAMFRFFPLFLSEYNAENLLVMLDQGRVVSHVGVALNWASIGGCAVGIACVGAVATYEEHRGKGLATTLMEAAIRHAEHWGADVMMISGGRGLYRRLGAADVGREYRLTISDTVAARLKPALTTLKPCTESDLAICHAFYTRKPAHFIRSPFEWSVYLHSSTAMCTDTDIWTVKYNNIPCGYWVVDRHPREGRLRVLEHAGDDLALAGSVSVLLSQYSASILELHLQEADTTLLGLFRESGAPVSEEHASGTYLILNFDRFMRRLQPFFEGRTDRKTVSHLRWYQEKNCFRLECWEETAVIEGKMALMETIFGNRQRQSFGGVFDKLFPVPPLWYGLNYV